MTALCLELSQYYEEGQFPMIRHPLVYAVPFFDTVEECLRLNKMLKFKQQAIAAAKEQHDWDSYIFLHERPYRLQAFMEVQEEMLDVCYWRVLRSVWIDSENVYQNRLQWWELLTSGRGKRHRFSDVTLRDQNRLPRELTVYRGTKSIERGSNYLGFSWTLDKSRAVWFATRFIQEDDGKPVVAIANIPRNSIVGYIRSRGEEEIVAMPVDLSARVWEEVDASDY